LSRTDRGSARARAQVLGKFGVIMADPPWEIHQDLPYGTMADEEMRRMGLGQLQDEGVIFLWVTGAPVGCRRVTAVGHQWVTAVGHRCRRGRRGWPPPREGGVGWGADGAPVSVTRLARTPGASRGQRLTEQL